MATKRQIFYSFHYQSDSWRTSEVRNMGVVEGNKPASDNDWETIKGDGENAIKRWINNQMKSRSCTVLLVGSNTANRKWINYEIIKSLEEGMGIVGIYIHGLKDSKGNTSSKGNNPFDHIGDGNIVHRNKKLSGIVKCYDPAGEDSKERYAWISGNLSRVVEEAIEIRKNDTSD